jgi:hypothetical protein
MGGETRSEAKRRGGAQPLLGQKQPFLLSETPRGSEQEPLRALQIRTLSCQVRNRTPKPNPRVSQFEIAPTNPTLGFPNSKSHHQTQPVGFWVRNRTNKPTARVSGFEIAPKSPRVGFSGSKSHQKVQRSRFLMLRRTANPELPGCACDAEEKNARRDEFDATPRNHRPMRRACGRSG